MIAIANNTLIITTHLEDLIDSVETYNIFSKDEIMIKIQKEEILNCLNIIRNFCIFRFSIDLYDVILEKFENHFLNLETQSIIELCDEVYSEFVLYINPKIKQKVWQEVFKNSTSNYILSLFLTDNKQIKKIDLLRQKIKEDKKKFADFFYEKIGEDESKEILMNLDYFLEFLESSSEMISLPCQSLIDFNGGSFTKENAKFLIEIRYDFSVKEKQEAIESCFEVFDKYKNEKKESLTTSLFDFVNQNLNNKIKRKSYLEDSRFLEDLEDNKKSINNTKRISINDMKDFGIDIDSEEDEPRISDKENNNKVENFFVPKNERESMNAQIEVIYSGEMKKKSNNM